jgi:hypothetical protein
LSRFIHRQLQLVRCVPVARLEAKYAPNRFFLRVLFRHHRAPHFRRLPPTFMTLIPHAFQASMGRTCAPCSPPSSDVGHAERIAVKQTGNSCRKPCALVAPAPRPGNEQAWMPESAIEAQDEQSHFAIQETRSSVCGQVADSRLSPVRSSARPRRRQHSIARAQGTPRRTSPPHRRHDRRRHLRAGARSCRGPLSSSTWPAPPPARPSASKE